MTTGGCYAKAVLTLDLNTLALRQYQVTTKTYMSLGSILNQVLNKQEVFTPLNVNTLKEH